MPKPDLNWISTTFLKILPPAFIALFLSFLIYRYLYYQELFYASDFSHYWVARPPGRGRSFHCRLRLFRISILIYLLHYGASQGISIK